MLSSLLFLAVTASAQDPTNTNASSDMVVVGGNSDSTVFGINKSVRITGTVKQGAISFGGDVIVEGTVEGDVAAIGGSVIQTDTARIGGDVIVLGGTYRHGEKTPNRNPSSMTMMYAGYQQEIRDIMRNPTGLLRPQLSLRYIGIRILAILFWFVVSLAFTAALPGSISRGVARLQLTSLRVALIGVIGALVMGVSSFVSLWILPEVLSALIGMLALMLFLVAGLFGRVILYAATGRWLQRKYIPVGKNSEAVALLLGSGFWVLLTSLPYIWPFVVSFIWVVSLGLALTARYRVGWERSQAERRPAF
ncbi:MAG: hypothetical protein C5B55_13175 [Blastocatellia bacterium]|nr:MAG: hypothetical protein C5B55_13175 [Blastocatellia bacterium]